MCNNQNRFYICKHCGNLVGMIHASGVRMVCCGEEMSELIANTSDGAHEKHVPAFFVEGNIVSVSIGSIAHPMTAEHHIVWVYLQTKAGGQRKCLEIGSEPKACFTLCEDDSPVSVYAYCNLHGLWKTDII